MLIQQLVGNQFQDNEFTRWCRFITATGGTITTSGDCKIHTFTGPGTFAISSNFKCTPANNVELSYLVVAGGGGGGGNAGSYSRWWRWRCRWF